MTKKIMLSLLILCSQSASAQYYAVGEIMAYVPSGIGKILPAFSKEKVPQKIHGVKHDDGKIYKVKRVYSDSAVTVTATNECLVHPTEDDPIYLGRKSDGGFDELKVSYLKFRCTKQSG
jgi:hypothetical protein